MTYEGQTQEVQNIGWYNSNAHVCTIFSEINTKGEVLILYHGHSIVMKLFFLVQVHNIIVTACEKCNTLVIMMWFKMQFVKRCIPTQAVRVSTNISHIICVESVGTLTLLKSSITTKYWSGKRKVKFMHVDRKWHKHAYQWMQSQKKLSHEQLLYIQSHKP